MFKSLKSESKLNKKRKLEGKVKELPNDQKVLEVGKETNEKVIDKDIKTTFEEFKILYKGKIDDKCIEDYGSLEDEKLWEDVAKELFLQSENYLPNEDDKAEKIEESKPYIRRKDGSEELTKSELNNKYKEWREDNNWSKEEYSFNDYLRDIDESGEWELVESKSERYQVREFEGPGAKFGVFDTKEKKFVQKGSKYVMDAACKDLNNKEIKKESVDLKNIIKCLANKKIQENFIYANTEDKNDTLSLNITDKLAKTSVGEIIDFGKVAGFVKINNTTYLIIKTDDDTVAAYSIDAGFPYIFKKIGVNEFESFDKDLEKVKEDSKEKGLYCEDKNDSTYYTYSIYTIDSKNDSWNWKDSFESKGVNDKKEAEEKAIAKVKELKDSGEFYDVMYKEWENDREEDKKYDIDISKYDTVDKIKDRIKEINSELAYCRRRDKVCATFGGDQQVYDLNTERDKLRDKLNKLKKTKTENYQLYYDDIQEMPTSERHLLWKQYHEEDFEDSEEGNNKFWDWVEEKFELRNSKSYEELDKELDDLIAKNATDIEFNDFLEEIADNEIISHKEYAELVKKAQETRKIDLKESLNKEDIINGFEPWLKSIGLSIEEADKDLLNQYISEGPFMDLQDEEDLEILNQAEDELKEKYKDLPEAEPDFLDESKEEIKKDLNIEPGSDEEEALDNIFDIDYEAMFDELDEKEQDKYLTLVDEVKKSKDTQTKMDNIIKTARDNNLDEALFIYTYFAKKDILKNREAAKRAMRSLGLEESKVTDYTLTEINKIIDTDDKNFKLQITSDNNKTKWLDIDKEDLEAMYKSLQNKEMKTESIDWKIDIHDKNYDYHNDEDGKYRRFDYEDTVYDYGTFEVDNQNCSVTHTINSYRVPEFNGTYNISSIHPYDNSEYHWARGKEGSGFYNIYLNHNFIEKVGVSNVADENEIERVAKRMIELDNEKNIKSNIDRS